MTGLIQLDWPLLVSAVRNVGRSLIIGRNWAAMQQRSREIPSGQSTRGSPQPPNSNDKWRLANQNKKREHVINYRRIWHDPFNYFNIFKRPVETTSPSPSALTPPPPHCCSFPPPLSVLPTRPLHVFKYIFILFFSILLWNLTKI